MTDYNPDFVSAVRARRALADMQRRMREAEAEALRLERAARDAADAILAGAIDEARRIVDRAYAAPAAAKRPAIEIVHEVALEYGVPDRALRAPVNRQTRTVQQARRAAAMRVWQEREDLSAADIARIMKADPGWVRRAVNGAGR